MKSEWAKVLHTLAGRPLLQHVLATAGSLGAQSLITVTGHRADQVEAAMRSAFPEAPLAFVLQQPQLGTGHAVQQAVPLLGEAGTTLILNGDVPLIEAATARALVEACGGTRLALLTLGNCIPLLGLFPQAAAYRSELPGLAACERLDWVDVSSPTDWGSFALLDPLELCGIDLPARGRGSPLTTSPRFHTLIEP